MHRRLTQDSCCLVGECIIHLLFQNALASSAQSPCSGIIVMRAPQPQLASCLSCRALATDQPSHSNTLPPSTFHDSLPHPPHTHQPTPASTTTPSPSINNTTSHASNNTYHCDHADLRQDPYVTPLHRRTSTSRWRRMLTHSQSRERPSPSRLSPRTPSTM